MEYVSEDNLTAEFGGTREYKHTDWLKYRMVRVLNILKQTLIHMLSFSKLNLL